MTESIPAPRRSLFRRLMGKGRRGVRKALFGTSGTAGQAQLDELWDWVNGMQSVVNTTASRVDEAFRRMDRESRENAEHTDLVIDQLWRRLEAADARIATHVQKIEASAGRQLADLQDVVARLRHENAAILRLIGHEEAKSDEIPESVLPIPRMTIFSEIERGASELLKREMQQYVPEFTESKGPILDIGCGKGDFLDLLRTAGVKGYGVDLDEDQARLAIQRGLDVRVEDLLEHLESLADNSLGGVFCSQVVEHLPAEILAPLYDELFRVVEPGGKVIVETPNPATFSTHVQSFWRDPTHIRPVPLPALDFAARLAGFVPQQTIYMHPSPENDRLSRIDIDPKDPLIAELVQRFNTNADKLDHLLFGFQDYALIVRKP